MVILLAMSPKKYAANTNVNMISINGASFYGPLFETLSRVANLVIDKPGTTPVTAVSQSFLTVTLRKNSYTEEIITNSLIIVSPRVLL